MKQSTLAKRSINTLKRFTDKNSPKTELRYGYVRSDGNTVAVDYDRMLVLNIPELSEYKDHFVDLNKVSGKNCTEVELAEGVSIDIFKGDELSFPNTEKLELSVANTQVIPFQSSDFNDCVFDIAEQGYRFSIANFEQLFIGNLPHIENLYKSKAENFYNLPFQISGQINGYDFVSVFLPIQR